MATAKEKSERIIQKSVTVGADDTTLSGLAEAAKVAGAPDSATVNIGGFYQPDPEKTDVTYAYSVTFTWTE